MNITCVEQQSASYSVLPIKCNRQRRLGDVWSDGKPLLITFLPCPEKRVRLSQTGRSSMRGCV
jgi:hypothetical protein